MEKFCIYCLRKDNLSRGHIFPISIGGSFWLNNICKNCNSVIGRSIESEIKECPFLVFGIDKIKIQKKERAFNKLSIKEKNTGVKFRYKQEILEPETLVQKNNKYVGNRIFVKERFLKWVEENRSNWVNYVKEQFDKENSVINVAGDKFKIENIDGWVDLEVSGKVQFPYKMLSKIVFKLMVCSVFPNTESLLNYYYSTFDIVKNNNKVNNIIVKDIFLKRVQCLNSNILGGKINLSELKYEPFHGFYFRITENGIAYIKISFFGVLTFLVAIDQVGKDVRINENLKNKAFHFLTNKHEVETYELDENKIEKVLKRDDAIANARFDSFLTYKKAGDDK